MLETLYLLSRHKLISPHIQLASALEFNSVPIDKRLENQCCKTASRGFGSTPKKRRREEEHCRSVRPSKRRVDEEKNNDVVHEAEDGQDIDEREKCQDVNGEGGDQGMIEEQNSQDDNQEEGEEDIENFEIEPMTDAEVENSGGITMPASHTPPDDGCVGLGIGKACEWERTPAKLRDRVARKSPVDAHMNTDTECVDTLRLFIRHSLTGHDFDHVCH